jgi:hypothetical protein
MRLGSSQHLAVMELDLYGMLMLGMAIGPTESAKLQALAALLASANAGKQSGLYTDFHPDSGSLTSPADVSEAGFGRIRPLIGDYVAETLRQLDDFASFRNTSSSTAGTR